MDDVIWRLKIFFGFFFFGKRNSGHCFIFMSDSIFLEERIFLQDLHRFLPFSVRFFKSHWEKSGFCFSFLFRGIAINGIGEIVIVILAKRYPTYLTPRRLRMIHVKICVPDASIWRASRIARRGVNAPLRETIH